MKRVIDQLLVNTRIHLKFFARNRLILVLALLFVAAAALSLVFSFFAGTSTGKFEVMRSILGEIEGLAQFMTPILGLMAVSTHLRNRSIRIVLTKPCSPEVWLASIYLAGAIVCAAVHILLLALPPVLSWIWAVPYQAGFAFETVDNFCRSMLWFAYLTTLTVAFHPVVAVGVVMVFNESTFYSLKFLIASATQTKGLSLGLQALQALNDTVYYAIPMAAPLSQKTEQVYASMRVLRGDGWLLIEIMAYTLLATGFFYSLSNFLLRRKSVV